MLEMLKSFNELTKFFLNKADYEVLKLYLDIMDWIESPNRLDSPNK